MADKYQMDMCNGPLLRKIVAFAFPLMMTYIIQLLFNAADLIVIGHYASHRAMAAIGSTMNMNSFVLNSFVGLSVGANVLAARSFGAGDSASVRKTVQTSMLCAGLGGIAVMIVGLLIAKPLLRLMNTPEDVLPLSCTYIWICFAGIPFVMIYNFGCSILRAVGDTMRPLYYLIAAGIVNVLLNLFLVIYCGMDVAGVAWATMASHGISGLLVLRALCRTKEVYHLELKTLFRDFDWGTMKEMLKIGIPAGVQSSCFSVSNMTIQSSINSFGALAMAGNTAAQGLEGIVYIGSCAFHYTAISFVSQNLGGKKYKRILRSIYGCYLCAFLATLVMGWGFYLFGEFFLGIYSPDPEVVAWGMVRLKYLLTVYFICGLMDVSSGALRGLGYSLQSAVLCLIGACAFRVLWVMFVMPYHHTMEMLLLSYPASWLLVVFLCGFYLVFAYRKAVQEQSGHQVFWSKLGPGVPRGYRSIGGPK